MSEEKKKRNKIIGISIGILVVLLVVISSTYAYWQITKSQDGSNDIIAACLSIDMQSVDGTFGINPAWPISDEEGMNLTGYTFKVTNNCEEDVAYVIGMDSLEVNGVEYLDYSNIKISIDNNTAVIYESDDTEDIEHIEENDPYTIRDSKKIATSVVKSGQPNIHNVKVWIKSESPVEEQSKVFSGRMFITGGQKIVNDKPLVQATPETCFEMNGGEIIGYDESCGESVIIPASVNGTPVTTIDSDAFKETTITYNYDYGIVAEDNNPIAAIVYNMEEYDNLLAWASRNGLGALPFYTEEPELTGNQKIQYCEDPVDGQMPLCLDAENLVLKDESPKVSIKELDLSQAINLDIIEESAFSNVPANVYDINEYKNYGTGLTSLDFGNNDKFMAFGNNAFANANLESLDLFASYHALQDIQNDNLSKPFGNTIINNLNVYATDEYNTLEFIINDKYYTQIYCGIKVNDFKINEGIISMLGNILYDSTIGKMVFPDSLNLVSLRSSRNLTIDELVLSDSLEVLPDDIFDGIAINKIDLPANLKTIGARTFQRTALTEIRIPATVTSIGTQAFYSPTNNLTIIFEGRSNLDGITLGDNWNGTLNNNITIKYEP